MFKTTETRHECEIVNKRATFLFINRREKNADKEMAKGWPTKAWVSLRDRLAHSGHSELRWMFS